MRHNPLDSPSLMPQLTPATVNTILYCADWAATVAFYRDRLGFPIVHATEWFVEFALTPTTRLSIADERRATIKSAQGAGITLTFQVDDADAVWEHSPLRASSRPLVVTTPGAHASSICATRRAIGWKSGRPTKVAAHAVIPNEVRNLK